MTMTTRRRRSSVAIGLVLGMAGCVTTTNTENLLTQAGFRRLPADSPQKVAHLQTLPERRLVGRTYQGKKYYVYSDPNGCKCLYIGNPAQYQSYHGILQQQQQSLAGGWPPTGGVEEAREWEIENSGLQ
jgi:hypothetical protein